MRVYEQSLDQYILPNMYIVARLDGRSFTRLTKEVCKFEATFDCRIIPLPNIERVCDYFLWRQEDAHRNSLNAHCYWMLRKEGLEQKKATEQLSGKTVSYKNELLFQNGINYNELPNWQKRGIGIYFQDVEKEGFNPVTNKNVRTTRRELIIDDELKLGDEYREFIRSLIEKTI